MKNRKLLMIPGPIEFEPAVMRAMGKPTTSHVAPSFIDSFSRSLKKMRELLLAPGSQPFILAGSGTLAMDSVGANLVEEGDKALVVSTGYFGERYATLLKRYGADVKILTCEPGKTVEQDSIEEELKSGQYNLLTFTHVDTSTAVRVDARMIGELGLKYGVLTVLDGVCSVAGEEIRQEEWGIDVVLTASQKAVGVPPGLALFTVSQKAMDVWRKRKSDVGSYYSDWTNWLPIMEAYEELRPSYFATPAVNMVEALSVSLDLIIAEGMEKRFRRHQETGRAFRKAFEKLGLSQLPVDESIAANTLSAPYYPDGVNGKQLLADIGASGVILAGGLLPGLKERYFRIGHMGAVNRADIMATLSALEFALKKQGCRFEEGAALSEAQKVLSGS